MTDNPPHGDRGAATQSSAVNEYVFYLPGLNGIRAIAALIVIVFHIDQYSGYFGLPSLGFYKNGMARFGVTLFFVLSGYLITYLLLIEKEKFGSIDFYRFYTRRILRIWPPYYLCILITVILLMVGFKFAGQDDNVWSTILLYSLLLSNAGFAFGYQLTPITPLWSIGVEEQFYAFWPLLIRNSRNILISLASVIVVYLSLKVGFRIFENGGFYNFLKYSLFSAMAIGGFGACLAIQKSRWLVLIYNPITQIVAWLVLVISIVYKPIQLVSIFDHELHAFFYIIIILNVSRNPKTIVSLENRILDFVGRISYGIYVYHMLLILLLSSLWPSTEGRSASLGDYVAVYSITIILTLSISYLSFKYIESFFLSLKAKYARIASSPSKV